MLGQEVVHKNIELEANMLFQRIEAVYEELVQWEWYDRVQTLSPLLCD